MQWQFSLIALFLGFTSLSQKNEASMIFVGDVMQHDGQIEAAYNSTTGTYDYADGFKFVKPILYDYDLRIANLEVTLAGKPYKGYPQFSAPDELAKTLVTSGFNVILTSNNHSCDRGANGVIRTLDVLDELGVKHTGTFRNKEERSAKYPLMIEQNGIKIAMLNYTYGTNGLTVKAPLIINYIDSNVIAADVKRAKELHADYIVCNMHWGIEYKPLPNDYQKKWEAYCYGLGVDMVIGNHPHVIQPTVKKKINNEDKLTVWSLGNFVSNMSIRYTRGGLMVGANIRKENNSTKLGDVNHHFVYVLKRQEGATKQYYILPDFDYNNYQKDFISAAEKIKMDEFFADSRKLYAEHTIGSQEKIVATDSKNGKLYKKLLQEYFTVSIDNPNFDLLLDKNIGQYLHETTGQDGKRYMLSGICESYEKARGVRQFIMDLKITDGVSILRITPTEITKYAE